VDDADNLNLSEYCDVWRLASSVYILYELHSQDICEEIVFDTFEVLEEVFVSTVYPQNKNCSDSVKWQRKKKSWRTVWKRCELWKEDVVLVIRTCSEYGCINSVSACDCMG
jgi:hypothetical protein